MSKILLRILVIMFLFGCTQIKEKLSSDESVVYGGKSYAESLVSTITPRWFKGPEKFSLQSDDGEIPKHFFFDVNPDIDMEKRTLNIIALTPQNSPYAYELDLLSGQKYMNHIYCPITDAWDQYKSKIEKPPYTIGVVPRVFDQLGTPQKVMVFGDEKYYQKNFQDNYFDVRIVGGFIEQVCEKGACLEQNQWSSRIVLIAIQKDYKKLSHIRAIDELQKEIDWGEVKAFSENGHGQNKIGNKFYPAMKMGALIDAATALKYVRNNSIFFTVKKLTKMRNSCYRLYDHIWKFLAKDSKLEKEIKKASSLIEIAKLEKKFRKNPNAFFYERLIRMFKKYNKDLKTCHKYIYYGNLNMDNERFWFFTYLKLFSLAHEEGYTYSCKRSVWVRNPYVAKGRRAVPLSKEFKQCNAQKIDKSFGQAINLLRTLKRNNIRSYRFLDYDRGAYGTHSKLYSWVPITNRRYDCPNNATEYYLTRDEFPRDKRWKKRRIKKLKKSKTFY